MGLYIAAADVKIRLSGKVRFTDDPDDENRFQDTLLDVLIDEAEGAVEQDLSPRYIAPFQTKDGTAFINLPNRPTKQIIKTLCELMACIRVLETDYGKGSTVNAADYTKMLQERYDKMLNDKILHKKEEHSNQWSFPPLPELRLNYFNTEADDGWQGSIEVTSQGDGAYPSKQIGDPSENFWTGTLDE